LLRARSRANPYELIRGAFFLNRAAMKMANMDAVFGFMFTDPKDSDGVSQIKSLAVSSLEVLMVAGI